MQHGHMKFTFIPMLSTYATTTQARADSTRYISFILGKYGIELKSIWAIVGQIQQLDGTV
jgi:hypothetical protein